jgi:hypothetical protein
MPRLTENIALPKPTLWLMATFDIAGKFQEPVLARGVIGAYSVNV